MVQHLVAVDSGGTHTNIRIETGEARTPRNMEIAGSLSSNRPDAELAPVFAEIFSAVRSHTGRSPISMWITAAGYSAPTRERFDQLLRDAAGEVNGRIGIANDAVSLLLARERELVVVIAGTGSVAMARQRSGKVTTRGGDEWVVADYGSAFWMGLEGLRAAYRALEGGPDTALLNSLLETFIPLDGPSKSSRDRMSQIARDLAALGGETKPRIARFARQVTRQAELGDDEAHKIVRGAVAELAAAAARVYREVATAAEPCRITPRFLLNGSVGYFSPFYRETFHNSLQEFLFDIRQRLECEIELDSQLNGLHEALALARRLADGEAIATLERAHPYTVLDPG